eukprot:11393640-Heterocapsa_arctica.AAC.1
MAQHRSDPPGHDSNPFLLLVALPVEGLDHLVGLHQVLEDVQHELLCETQVVVRQLQLCDQLGEFQQHLRVVLQGRLLNVLQPCDGGHEGSED